MSAVEPATATEWDAYVRAADRAWRRACGEREAAQRALDAAYEGRRRWREQPAQMEAAWSPILARLSGEVGIDFCLTQTGGGCMAAEGRFGPLRILITDYGDGDLSHPEAGTGWWAGFYLSDAPWRGDAESMVGDPDARTAEELARFVAHAVADYWRGVRLEVSRSPGDYEDGIPRQVYGDE